MEPFGLLKWSAKVRIWAEKNANTLKKEELLLNNEPPGQNKRAAPRMRGGSL